MMDQKDYKQDVYPKELIDLPSGGRFYPKGSPLSSGQLEVYLMTAKHEDILTSSNLIRKGVVLDRLMDALIATPGVKSADLLAGDLNALMVAARILGYGKDYPVSFRCPACGKTVQQVVDLTQLDMTGQPDDETEGQLTFELPASGATVQIRFLTRQDELDIEAELAQLQKVGGEVEGETTAKLRAMIVSVNGDDSVGAIWKFVDSMLVRDSRFLRERYRRLSPDVDFEVPVECECPGSGQATARLPIGSNFFWPDT